MKMKNLEIKGLEMKTRTKFGLGQKVFTFQNGNLIQAEVEAISKNVGFGTERNIISKTIYTLYFQHTTSVPAILRMGEYLEEDIFETEEEAMNNYDIRFLIEKEIQDLIKKSGQDEKYKGLSIEDKINIRAFDLKLYEAKVETLRWVLRIDSKLKGW